MDVYGIEALLDLPEFHVINQAIRPKRLELHLQRRETSIVCPRCQTCCCRVQDRVKKQLDPEEAKALKKLRRRWLKSANQLDVDELIARYEWCRRFPQLHEMIAWVQDLRMWFERKYEKPAREALLKLIERASQSAQEPLKRMAGTLTRWFEPIVHYIRNRYSNGMTEGFNNKIKLIQRMAYGLRNEHNRRKRIMVYCGKT